MYRTCFRSILVCVWWLLVCVTQGELFGPSYKPTKGAVWPRPQQLISQQYYYKLNSQLLNITIVHHTCQILNDAVERYYDVIRDYQELASSLSRPLPGEQRRSPVEEVNYKGYMNHLAVDLMAPCETLPYFGMDEFYDLIVDQVSVIRSGSVWGALRGLESWAQLFYIQEDEPELRVNQTSITDAPRYPHRGLMLDTSRHYLSLATILANLDAMAVNKMNVFHWHIVDDQSFPYQSDKFPELSARGAFHRSLVYTREDIETVVAYATARGIRVLPEFDVPGHTRSWGESHPEILTHCYKNGRPAGLGPMNPVSNKTYELLRDLFAEVHQRFPDKYLHVGGDEVGYECWNSNPELQQYMKKNHLTPAKLYGLFMSKVMPLLGEGYQPIVWQEVFDEGVQLSKETLVHVWQTNEYQGVLQKGHSVLLSSPWYLNHLSTGGDWQRMYRVQLEEVSGAGGKVVGGEACMWAEDVDDESVLTRVWPRACATAEILWSGSPDGRSPIPSREVYSRLEEHACRMKQRGMRTQPPNGPGFCRTHPY